MKLRIRPWRIDEVARGMAGVFPPEDFSDYLPQTAAQDAGV
jgi:hypothetical protein